MFKLRICNISKKYLYSTIDNKIVNNILVEKLTPKNDAIEKSIKERYNNKLLIKARENGFSNIDDYKKHLSKQQGPQKDDSQMLRASELPIEKEALNIKKKLVTGTKKAKQKPATPFKTLDSYINVSKFRDLDNSQIEQLWKLRFKDSLSAVIPETIMNNMLSRIEKYPRFVIPLPHHTGGNNEVKKQGYDLHYLQWSKANKDMWYCLFTSLQEFKLNKEFARPHTILEFHFELLKEKKIVLMNGSKQEKPETNGTNPIQNMPTMDQIPVLIWHLQKIYNFSLNFTENEKIVKLLQQFNSGDSGFDLNQLIAFCEDNK